jgi:tRNA dimethylallyltransferase
MSKIKPKIIVVLGPTASGKSSLAVKLARKFGGEIIGADSRQIYKELKIGTDKVPGRWNNQVYYYKDIRHYLIDIIPPNKIYSVGEFKADAEKIIEDILERDKVPIIAGGTAQYIYSLVDNWQIPKIKASQKVRKKLEKELKQKGLDYLWKKLVKLDPGAKKIVQRANPRRIIRALEVIELTGKKFSQVRKRQTAKYNFLLIAPKVSRDILYLRIDKRVDQMVKDGLLREVKRLIKKYPRKSILSQTTGYLELIPFLRSALYKGRKEEGLNKAIQQIKYNTHRYVRHQMNWFGKDKRIKWVSNLTAAENITARFVKQ